MSCISQESYTRECSALQRARRLGLLSLASKDTRSNYVCGVLKPWPGRNRTGFFWFSNGRPSTAPQRRLQPPNFVFPTQRGEAAYLHSQKPLGPHAVPPRGARTRTPLPPSLQDFLHLMLHVLQPRGFANPLSPVHWKPLEVMERGFLCTFPFCAIAAI